MSRIGIFKDYENRVDEQEPPQEESESPYEDTGSSPKSVPPSVQEVEAEELEELRGSTKSHWD